VRREQRTGTVRPAAGAWALAAAALLVAGASCGDDSGPSGSPPDTAPPEIVIVFPTDGAYDRDGDGLVDVEVTFADSGRGIDLATIQLTSDRSLKGSPGAGEDLLPAWTVTRADSAGLVLEETLEHLLPRGPGALTVSATDRAGNRSEVAIEIDLPPAALHKVIDLEAEVFLGTNQITIGPDERFAYVTTEERGGSAVSVVDLDSLCLKSVSRSPVNALVRTSLDRGRRRLYLMSVDEPELAVYDLGTRSFIATVETSSRGIGVAYDAARDRVYAGLEVQQANSAVISVIDPAQLREVETVNLGIGSAGNPGTMIGMNQFVLDPPRNRLYALTNGNGQQGVLEIALPDLELVGQFDLWPEREDLLGGGVDLDLDGDRLLAVILRNARGTVARVPLGGSPVTFVEVGPLATRELAISPDRTEWVIAAIRDLEATVRIVDALREEVIWVGTVNPGEFQDVEFHPNGHAFMVAGTAESTFPQPSPSQLIVYLYR